MKSTAAALMSVLLICLGITAVGQDNRSFLKHRLALINTGETHIIDMDTAITGGQIYHPQYKYYPSWSELGNMGSPAIPNTYNGISSPASPFLFKPYYLYLEENDKIKFFNARKPYSEIRYNSGGTAKKGGQNLGFLYTRNFEKEINVVGSFDFISSVGDLSRQSTSESTIRVAIAVEKQRYQHYASLERIQFKLQENGGVADDEEAISKPKEYLSTIAVNLEDASSTMSTLRMRGWQQFDLFAPAPPDSTDSTIVVKTLNPKRPRFIHKYNFTSAKRIYLDNPNNNPFYTDTFISGVETIDSIQFYSFQNDINARIKGFIADSSKWTLEAGLHHELLHYYSHENPNWKQRVGIGGLGRLELKRIFLSGEGLFYLAGYGAGNFSLDLKAGLNKTVNYGGPEIRFSTKSYSPDLFLQEYSSNHYRWINNFSAQQEQRIGINWHIPIWNLSLEANSYLISNWIYFNTDAHPEQKENSAFLGSLGINKKFKLGPLRSNNKVFLSYTEAKEIPVPLVSASSSTFMHHDIHFEKTSGLLQVEYGFDIRYSTEYSGYAYMPATGAFYLQNDRMLGNYPVINVFLMLKVQRTRFFVKMDHVNSGFTGDNIFTVLHYPIKQRFLKYGVFWNFYD